MKIAVFGGSGLTGGALVQLAVQEGHEVRALVREATTPPPTLAQVEIVRGDALDPDAVARTIAGSDAVVSTLGGFRGPASIAAGNANIVAAMRRNGPGRLVVLQGFHIAFPGDPHNPGKNVVKVLLALRCRPLLGYSAALGSMLQETDDLAWTLVRIPRVVEGPASGWAQTGRFALGPTSHVRIGDTSSTVLELAASSAYVHDAPMLVTPRRPPSTTADSGLTGTAAAA